MPKASIWKTLFNKDGVYTAIWATVQQLVVASSTYFIIAAIRSATATATATANDYDRAMWFASAFVASLIAVFVPNTLSMFYWQKWRLESFSRYVGLFMRGNAGRTTFVHSRDKARHESWLTNESSIVYENGLRILHDLYQIFLSTVLNILVIALAIDLHILCIAPRVSGDRESRVSGAHR